MTAVVAPAPTPASEGERLTRSTATISAFTLVSRVTGFARIFVLAAVVGTTFLGNTYQAANSVPNLVFELFAAGALQAVLVPELIEVTSRRGRAAGRQVASLVLGGLLAAFGVVVVIGAVVAPLVARILFAAGDEAIRADQVWLGTVFLWVFLPQVLFYAGGLVATAVLNADDRFAVPAFAPVLNNVVVILAYLGFWWMRDGEPPSLHLSPAEVAVLAGGTTLGVVVFTSAPVISAVRLGLLHRPRLALRDRDLRRLARKGAARPAMRECMSSITATLPGWCSAGTAPGEPGGSGPAHVRIIIPQHLTTAILSIAAGSQRSAVPRPLRW